MFLTLRKTLFVLLTLLLSLFFTVGCSCSKETDQAPSLNPNIKEPSTVVEHAEDPETASEDSNLEVKKDIPITFEDPIIYALLKKELKKDDITPKDLEKFTGFTILANEFILLSGEGIKEKDVVYYNEDTFEYDDVRYTGFGTLKSLADLKYFKNLIKLNITLQPEIDYSTIPENILKTVSSLYIYQSRLEDISFLKPAENLHFICLSTNNIKDLSPLVGKESITWLDMNWNDVEDLAPLSGMTNLKSFSAYGNKITNLAPLENLTKLESIKLYQNLIKDISPLQNMRALKSIEIINNQIEDVSPLKEFTSFEELRLSGNPIKNIDLLSHIQNLEYDPVY